MAIRFDIDKYRDIRNTYIQYLKGDVVPNIQQTQLFEKYKSYWQNDDEVKAAENEYRKKREQCDVGGWKLVKDRNNEINSKNKIEKTNKTSAKNKINVVNNKSVKEIVNVVNKRDAGLSRYVQNKQTKIIVRAEYDKKEKEIYEKRLLTIANVLHVETTSDGGFIDIEKINSFIKNTKTLSMINTIVADLQDIVSKKFISTKTYCLIVKFIKEQKEFLEYAARNRKIASKPNSFFDVADQETAGRLLGKRDNKPKKEEIIKHHSVYAFSGGIPGLGKRH